MPVSELATAAIATPRNNADETLTDATCVECARSSRSGLSGSTPTATAENIVANRAALRKAIRKEPRPEWTTAAITISTP